jgi:hypothetical protein
MLVGAGTNKEVYSTCDYSLNNVRSRPAKLGDRLTPLTGPPQTVVLYGDPTRSGVFVSRVKFSARWKDPPTLAF